MYTSIDGPAGKLSWNSEGYLEATTELGIIQNDGSIILNNANRYLNPSYSFINMSVVCDWKTGIIEERSIYKVILLNIYDPDNDAYDSSYSQYLQLMVSVMNDIENGVNGHVLKGIKPNLRSIDELEEYVKNNGNDNELLAFFGTKTNEERERIHKYLVEYKKLLFSIFPCEGEQSLKNVIQIGRIPAHYTSTTFGYFYKRTKQYAILFNPNDNQSIGISEYLDTFCKTFETMNCTKYEIKNEDDIDEFYEDLEINYPDGCGIFSIIQSNIKILLEKMNGTYTSDDYPVIMLDIISSHFLNSEISKGHYFITSYVHSYDYILNNLMIKYFNNIYGEDVYLATEVSINIYNALKLLVLGVKSCNSIEADTLREEIYRTTTDVSDNEMTISSRNIRILRIFLVQFNGIDYDIIINPTNSLDVFPLSYLLNENKTQFEYDYSISDEIQEATISEIGFYVHRKAESLYFLADMYINIKNSEGGINGIPYVLLYYIYSNYIKYIVILMMI